MIRNAKASDLDIMLNWAASEGWNPGLDDAAAFLAADPKGFFVTEDAGRIVACISVVNHSDSFAFLGFYICHPEWRGRGVGFALWQEALRHAGSRTVGLDGVADQQANYARSGFTLFGATRRFEGPAETLPQGDFVPAQPDDTDALLQLDKTAFGVARPAFLSAWTASQPTRATLVDHQNGQAQGFATARQCRRGVKIGPVVAPSDTSALALAGSVAATQQAELAIIDVPDTQPALQDSLRALGFVETFGTARMYRGPAPNASSLARAVGTLELG